jgi:rhodanese-related sulfurtransferase
MKLKQLFSSLVLGTLLIAAQSGAQASTAVTLEAARDAIDKSSTVVIDIREPGEQTDGVAKGALLIPMGQLEKRLGDITKSKDQPVILICQTQNRSAKVADQLSAAGYTQISYVKGGMREWAARGWPTVKP